MKKQFIYLVASLLLIPLTLCICTLALPAQYDDTFLGELQYKREILAKESEKPRIVLVGGSAVAFGVDSSLIEEELPDYDVVNFGLYAALGTRVMLDLSVNDLREGDIVIVIPEQQEQTLSDYLGAAAMWQAADGDYDALLALHRRDVGEVLAAWPDFAISKLRYAIEGRPELEGIYRRDSFNVDGDIESDRNVSNVMAAGYDPTTPIDWSTDLPTAEFCTALNEYTAAAEEIGAAVWYHFPPMNAAASTAAEAGIDAYAEALQNRIDAPLAGDPKDCVMDSGWFYDTNFHLNQSGRTVYTRQLIRDIKAMQGNTTATTITIPEMPASQYEMEIAADHSDAVYFVYEESEDGLTLKGLTEEGRTRTTLTVPGEINGQAVTSLDVGAFEGAARLQRITIQQNITALPDGLFADSTALREIVILETSPARLLVGQDLLDGVPSDCRILVPEASYNDYLLSYSWAAYADRIDVNDTES